jgi:Flp pilus assembly protein protease CpaA
MIITPENLFLIILGIVWIIGAVLQDLRRREVDNIWNFSLIGIAIAYRLIVYAFNGNYWFALNGLIGFLIFLGLGNLFYYMRLFAGGDAKLLIALGTILPLSYEWMTNMKIFGIFLILSFLGGSIYALCWTMVLMTKNFKKFKEEFLKQAKEYKKMFLIGLVFATGWMVFIWFTGEFMLMLIALVILLFPFLFVFAKAIEECAMVKSVFPSQVTEGDWLYKDIIVNGKRIKANWEGISKEELKLIKSRHDKKISIKYGIPFTPSFLFGFLVLLYMMLKGIWF